MRRVRQWMLELSPCCEFSGGMLAGSWGMGVFWVVRLERRKSECLEMLHDIRSRSGVPGGRRWRNKVLTNDYNCGLMTTSADNCFSIWCFMSKDAERPALSP